jgi:DNA/RNA endonuclease G (NUC1)
MRTAFFNKLCNDADYHKLVQDLAQKQKSVKSFDCVCGTRIKRHKELNEYSHYVLTYNDCERIANWGALREAVKTF